MLAKSKGFTIVELLVVIVVIAVLAAITIVAYNGIQRQAIETTMQSDLKGAATQTQLDQTTTGSLPATAGAANGGKGLKSSGNNVLSYELKPYGYCIAATNTKTPNSFRIKSNRGQVEAGDCSVTVSTLAGSTNGSTEGPVASARFYYPFGIDIDSSGALYVADTYNYRIRKISTSNSINTLAGSSWGYLDNSGSAAQFKELHSIEVDGSGVLYIADAYNFRVRKVTPAGAVTTFAGSSQGNTDGTGTGAQFTFPYDIAVDSSGTAYVTDKSSNRIRKISPTGTVTTLAGGATEGYLDATGSAAQFSDPAGIALDANGNLYVADCNNHRIRKVSQAGVVTTFAGSTQGYADGTGSAAQFSSPCDVEVDANGNVFVVDVGNQRIRVISPTGVVTTLAGSTLGNADGPGTTAQFNNPNGLVVAPNNVVYVADTDNHRIRKIEY